MGLMSFLLPPSLPEEALQELKQACVTGGPDGTPWPSDVQIQAERLTIRRTVEESGALAAPWDIPDLGRVMTSSATLMERQAPYDLLVELARGKVNQVRCQLADWRTGGLQVPPELVEQIRQVSFLFGRAATRAPSHESHTLALQALGNAFRVAEQLVHVYLTQVFLVRHQHHVQLDTSFGCRLGAEVPEGEQAAALLQACNSVCVPLPWNICEATAGAFRWDSTDALLDWCDDHALAVCAGPLLDFSSARLPEWLWRYEGDLSALSRFMSRYVETAVRRYRKRVQRWHLTSGSNSASVLSLSEDELLLLTVRIVEVARQVDPGLQVILGLAQPWGEYLRDQDRNHSPFIFADTLIRAGLALTALDIEIVPGVSPRGSYCRDLLDTSRLLDLYSLLGVPLWVTLGYPSSPASDPRSDPDLAATAGHWQGGTSLATQAEWARAFSELAVGKPFVQAVHWADFSDAQVHQFPSTGLIDGQGQPKPVLQVLQQLRQQHLL
jgi:hypothetical protein